MTADLTPANVDDLPGFAELWSEGRLVRSYRVDERQMTVAGQRSTFVSTVHPRSPVLRSGISILNLETAIGRGGVSRTTASCILRYSREQSVTVELGPSTKLLSAEVDGRPVEPLQELDAVEMSTRRIPLPPRAYATLRLVYEREGEPWTGAGSWEASGPSFSGIPVGEVRWDIYYPAGLEVDVRGESMDSLSGQRVLTFARTFWGRIFSGRWPPLIGFLNSWIPLKSCRIAERNLRQTGLRK